MADAVKKLVPIRKVFDDEDFDLSAENQGYYCQQLQCENLSGAMETLGNYKMAALADGAQTLTAGFWFLAHIIPKATGYSFFMLPSNAYSTYHIPLYDPNYPQNPKSADWNTKVLNPHDKAGPAAKFEGFKAHGWQCTKKVTDPDTLEQSDKVMECNDNTILYDLITYNKGTDAKTKNLLKTKKFDFACNQYKAQRAEFQGDQMYVVAQGNNESIVLFKTPDGILCFNWASVEYKGNRPNVGSMSNGLSDCIGFVNELIEREMLGGEKF